MTRLLPICFIISAVVFIGCNRGDTPKSDGSNKETKIAQDGGKKDNTTPPDGNKNENPLAKDIGGQGKKESGTEQKRNDEPKTAARKTDFEVKFEALAAEFIANGKAAAKKYKDKIIEFTDKIDGIPLTGAVHFHTVVKKTKDDAGVLVTMACTALPGSYDTAMRCSRGQTVKVQTRITGWISDNNIIASDEARITAIDKSTLLTVNAVDLAKEAEKDAFAASQKYLKAFILTGVVEDLTRNKYRNAVAMLKTGTKLRVGVIIFDEDRYRQLKKGQDIEVRCGGFNTIQNNELIMSAALLKNK